MRYLQNKIFIAGLLATTSTFAYAQTAEPWPEYHEGFALDGSPTPRPHSACERKLIRDNWLWDCDPAAPGNPFRQSAIPPAAPGPTLADDAGGVRYYNAVSPTGRRTRAPSRECIVVQYDRDLLWTCPPLTTASIGAPTPAPTPQGATAGNVQYYSAVSSNGRRTRAPNAACALFQQGDSQYWICPPLTTGALSSGGPSGAASSGGGGAGDGSGSGSNNGASGNSGGSQGGGQSGGGQGGSSQGGGGQSGGSQGGGSQSGGSQGGGSQGGGS
ncbi:hypothetical protein SAMN05216304_109227, partial [Bosea sp. OK403]